jgi:hypothetical protein
VPVVRAADHTVTHSLYVLDPGGNELELYIDVAGSTGETTPTWSWRRCVPSSSEPPRGRGAERTRAGSGYEGRCGPSRARAEEPERRDR